MKKGEVACEECETFEPYEWMNGVGLCKTKEHGMWQDDSCDEGRVKKDGKNRDPK